MIRMPDPPVGALAGIDADEIMKELGPGVYNWHVITEEERYWRAGAQSALYCTTRHRPLLALPL